MVCVIGEVLEGDGLQGYFGERSGGAGADSLDHVAFSAANLEAIRGGSIASAPGTRRARYRCPGLIQPFETEPGGMLWS